MATWKIVVLAPLAALLACAGCRGVPSAQSVRRLVDTSEAVLQAVQLAERVFFSANPDPERQKRVERLMVDVELLRAEAIDAGNDPAAAGRVQRAWHELRQLLVDCGVAVPDGVVGVARPKNGVAPVRLPEWLHLGG